MRARRNSVSRMRGPLVEYVDGFRAVLLSQGYTPVSARMQLQLMSHVSRWLADEEVAASDLTPPRVEQFLDARRAEGYVQWLSPRAVAPLLGYLRDLGVVETPASEPTATEALLARYHDWLVSQRGLAAATARGYVDMVRPFIAARAADDGVALADLTAGDVTGFVLATCRGGARGSAKLRVTALRSLLGFLGVKGLAAVSLVDAVPSVAGWRLAGLPKGLEPGEVARLLASCDRRTRVGRRDLAILTLLVRLGLRAGEVAGLSLEDVDWRAGQLMVHGKANRVAQLPLPVDVGEAMVAYLRRGRPATAQGRSVFVRVRAPHRALTPAGVSAVCSPPANAPGWASSARTGCATPRRPVCCAPVRR